MKILFIHQSLISFVQKDLDILRTKHEVRELQIFGKENKVVCLVPNLLKLVSGVIWCDITFSWFGKLHAFFTVLFSKILGKKSVVVAGGDDVACEPSINYGMFAFKYKKWCPLFVFKYADLILSVSNFNHKETIINAKADEQKVKTIYHGFSLDKFHRIASIEKTDTVITIGSITSETLVKKGLALFMETAKYLPKIDFILIGPVEFNLLRKLKAEAANNLTLTGGVYGEDLVKICNKARIYVQVSEHESFGCSIAEAMLCECVPVVSRKAAIPEVVGDCGIYVDDLKPKEIAKKIKEALDSNLAQKAKERIQTTFSFEKRKNLILDSVEELIL